MEQRRRFADYLTGSSTAADDAKADRGPLPTRAWVHPIENAESSDDFHCLVEDHPGGHWERTGGLAELLRWALLQRSAQEFYLWNDERRDWDRPGPDEVRRLIQEP